MTKQELEQLIEHIKEDDSRTFELTPRKIMEAFGYCKRTGNNLREVNRFLNANQVETTPDYADGWIDGKILLKHKRKATSKVENDPIRKLAILEAANLPPLTITNDATLQEATTRMLLNDYSQLPVMSNPRSVLGYISWKTIGSGLANGKNSPYAKDYVERDIQILSLDTPLLAAVKIVYENEFALVQRTDKTLCGIVTTADLSSQFLVATEPFLLLEQIENHIRKILDRKILVEDLQKFTKQDNPRTIESIDDLSFGEYLRVMQSESWDKLDLASDKTLLLKELEEIRLIRNDVMHFSPDGIDENQRRKLTLMASYLPKICQQ